MAYIFVMGDDKVNALIKVEYSINQILIWIVFTTEEQRNSIYDDSIDSFSDIRMFTEEDISNFSTEFSGRAHANRKIHFGMSRNKIMH